MYYKILVNILVIFIWTNLDLIFVISYAVKKDSISQPDKIKIRLSTFSSRFITVYPRYEPVASSCSPYRDREE